MTYLIAISIGPVQDFIATARRSRDLWFGSWLLSELAKAAAKVIKTDSLIFPFVKDQSELDDDEFNAPNKILAQVENPKDIAEKIQSAIDTRLAEIATKAFDKIKSNSNQFKRSVAEKQVVEMCEFYWAAVPFDESTDDYAKARKRVEYLLAARKATRNFKEVSWGANVPKSALDGQRESVIDEKVFDDARNGNMSVETLRRNFRVGKAERLCGVGLLKRHGNRGNQDKFFSTSHIAALPLLKRLSNVGAVEQFIDKLKGIGISENDLNTTPRKHPVFGYQDGHLLYEERMRDYFDEEGDIVKAKKIVRDFLQTAFGGKNPSPYYAVLLADGDSMGKAIDAQGSPKKHRELSKALNEFVKSVKPIVNNCEGSLIYAGGDDILALVPIHTVLDCAKALADEFKKQLKKFPYKDEETGDMKSPTLSVGIAVAHHIEPLQDALALARQAEKKAKGEKGKDALAVIVDKRSGTSRIIKGQWGAIDERLRQLIDFDKSDDISRQTAYELRDLASQLEVANQDVAQKLYEIKIVEAERILKRKLSEMGKKDFDKEKFSRMFELLKERDGIAKLADELIVAKVFADAVRQAGDK